MTDKKFLITEGNVDKYAKGIAQRIKAIVEKSERRGIALGMSGGIDCSVVAKLCQLAKIKTHLVLMPYGKDMANSKSYEHAMELIQKFDFEYHTYDIQPAVEASQIPDGSELLGKDQENIKLARANLRPRERMKHLYEYAQCHSLYVIGTGNLSERTVGYFTKWGDGACDLNPLAMVTKREVYILAKYLQIPESIIYKKPSAGLWEGQTDEDELGMTYEEIDDYILNGTSKRPEIDQLIRKRERMSAHKLNPIPIFNKKIC